eukprot:5791898-Amphidinium_carterae.1
MLASISASRCHSFCSRLRRSTSNHRYPGYYVDKMPHAHLHIDLDLFYQSFKPHHITDLQHNAYPPFERNTPTAPCTTRPELATANSFCCELDRCKAAHTSIQGLICQSLTQSIPCPECRDAAALC